MDLVNKIPEVKPESNGPDQNNFLRNLRELTAVGISSIIVVGFLVMIFWTYNYMDATNESEKFQRAKDLLLIINPFFGIVIGYYFNKVSTESRADFAEKTAQNATATTAAAEANKDAAKKETETARVALIKLSTAADIVLEEHNPTGANLKAEGEDIAKPTLERLRIANARAKEILVQ